MNNLPVPDDALFVSLPRAKQRVIDAVKQLGLKVLPSDVVARTGLPIHEATSLLNKIAAETEATLQVGEVGQIYYVFAPKFESKYSLRGFERTCRSFFLVLFRTGFFILRFSFGAMLILSLAIIVLFIIISVIAMFFGDSGGGDVGGGGGGDLGFFDIGSIGDGFSWNYTDSHQRKIEKYGVSERSWRPKEQVKQGNFFLECFSFLFGDGDPNSSLEEQKWKIVAEVICANNFVVTAEQIAPYTDKDPKDESGMFETLARFDGVPVVTEKGTIIYDFDSLRRRMLPEAIKTSGPRYLHEEEWHFSEYPAPALITVFIFATLNFLGSWWLFKHIATIALLQHFVLLIDVMIAYGFLFLLIPLCRLLFNALMNSQISIRNQRRGEYAQLRTTTEVRAKVAEATDYAATKKPVIGSSRIIYSTDKDALEQQFDQLPQTDNS